MTTPSSERGRRRLVAKPTALRRRVVTTRLSCLLLAVTVVGAADVHEPNVALWAPRIEYSAGEPLLLRPRFPAVDTTAIQGYEQSTSRELGGKLTRLCNQKVESIYRQVQGRQGIVSMSVKA